MADCSENPNKHSCGEDKQYKNNQQNNKKPFKQTQCVDSAMYNNASNALLLTRRIQLLCY